MWLWWPDRALQERLGLPDTGPADLHTHTSFSDGRLTPRLVVERAARLGIRCISITDHNTVAGLEEGSEASRQIGCFLVAGLEITAQRDGKACHILGYGIEPSSPELVSSLALWERQSVEYVEDCLTGLRAMGEEIELGDLLTFRTCYPGPAVLLLALVKKGFIRSRARLKTMLALLAAAPKPCSFHEAIELVHRSRGLASLAHPWRIEGGNPLLTSDYLAPMLEAGLDALEVASPRVPENVAAHYQGLAEDLGLLATAGTDFHGRAP